MNVEAALRASAAGAATGGRTFTGLAALVLVTPAGAMRQPDRTLGTVWAKAATVALAGAEIVADKLPQAPSRLGAPGLGGRLVTAVGVGALVANRSVAAPEQDYAGVELAPAAAAPRDEARRRREIAVGAAVALLTSAATTWLGNRARGLASHRLGSDRWGAVAEDVVTIGLAYCAARPAL